MLEGLGFRVLARVYCRGLATKLIRKVGIQRL